MYCTVTPTVGLVPISDAASNYPNLAGMLQTGSYYVGQPCPGVASDGGYQNPMRLTYNTHFHYQVMASSANDARYLESAQVNAYYKALEEEEYKTSRYVPNEGIPLSALIEDGMKSRKNLAFAFCDQYKSMVNVSTDSAISPSSSSLVTLSNESSGYASSSGRSSESPSDSHISDSVFSSSTRYYQQSEKRGRYLDLPSQVERHIASYEVIDKNAVRPRIRPVKPVRKSIIKTENLVEPHNRDLIKTPECGLLCQRKSLSRSTELLKSNHYTSKIRNIEMEVDEPPHRYAEAPRHSRACTQKKSSTDKMSLPIKERIKRFDKIKHIDQKYTYGDSPSLQLKQQHRNGSYGNTLDNNTISEKRSPKKSTQDKQNKNKSSPKTKNVIEDKMEKAKQELKQSSRKMFLGMYEVQSVLGVGGGGTVYAGMRTVDSKPIAIKRIMREKIKRWEKVQGRKVPQEIVLMLKVNGHKNVIRLLDWYECLDSFILILDRPQNCVDLFDYIRDNGRIKEDEAAYIFKQVVEAVKHIQSRGVLHRDIKDENVVINRDTKRSKIIDFGCGTNLHDGTYTDFSGTPEFYPPEWFSKRGYQGRTAAIWSLGVLLYDMLCGEIPFKTKGKIVANILTFKVPISQKAKHLIMWMLCSEADARPSLDEVLQHPWLQYPKH